MVGLVRANSSLFFSVPKSHYTNLKNVDQDFQKYLGNLRNSGLGGRSEVRGKDLSWDLLNNFEWANGHKSHPLSLPYAVIGGSSKNNVASPKFAK